MVDADAQQVSEGPYIEIGHDYFSRDASNDSIAVEAISSNSNLLIGSNPDNTGSTKPIVCHIVIPFEVRMS